MTDRRDLFMHLFLLTVHTKSVINPPGPWLDFLS